MLKIRLSRTGKKHAPSFRIVVIPKERPRDGEALEVLGYFNPSVNPPTFSIDKNRLKYWVERGAQMTETVEKLTKGKYEFKPYFGARQKRVEKEGSERSEGSYQPKKEPKPDKKEKETEVKTKEAGKSEGQNRKPKKKVAKTEVGAKETTETPAKRALAVKDRS